MNIRLAALLALGLAVVAGAARAQVAYTHQDPAFTLSHPPGFTVDEKYRYDRMISGKPIAGVAFLVPAPLTEGTNLAPDSYLSVEWKPGTSCKLDDFLEDANEPHTLNDSGVTWRVGEVGGAGAGNIFEETAYVSGCRAVRTWIHSTNIANYEPGKVRAFDRAGLLAAFDTMRRSLK